MNGPDGTVRGGVSGGPGGVGGATGVGPGGAGLVPGTGGAGGLGPGAIKPGKSMFLGKFNGHELDLVSDNP